MRYLTVALAKGRLTARAMEMFEKIGISCEEMKDKDSRKLIFANEELGIRFFLAKATDVPTYVEYGAADIGIAGRDTILEEGRKLYEVMDLGDRPVQDVRLRTGISRGAAKASRVNPGSDKIPQYCQGLFSQPEIPDCRDHPAQRLY